MGLVLGKVYGAYVASSISTYLLQQIFAIYALVQSIQLWFSMPHFAISSRLLKHSCLSATGNIFANGSVLVVMGGGTIIAIFI